MGVEKKDMMRNEEYEKVIRPQMKYRQGLKITTFPW